MVTFYEFVRDALLVLQGRANVAPMPTFKATLAAPIRKAPGRTEFQRGMLSPDDAGGWQVRTTGDQGSGILSSMSQANCFIVLPADTGNVDAGTAVDVQLLEGLITRYVSVGRPLRRAAPGGHERSARGGMFISSTARSPSRSSSSIRRSSSNTSRDFARYASRSFCSCRQNQASSRSSQPARVGSTDLAAGFAAAAGVSARRGARRGLRSACRAPRPVTWRQCPRMLSLK